jgi:type I restriction enzyme S subunit
MTLYKFYKKSNPSVAVAKIVFNHLSSKFPIKKIEEIAESTSGGTPNRGISEYFGGDIPWIKSGELNDSHITSCEEYITEVGLKNSSAKLYPKGTLVLALYGATVGKTGILDFEASSNQAVCAVYPNKEIDRDYMFWFFRQKRHEYIESSFGGAQPNISQKVVKETDIPVPSLEIQKEIVTFLNQCELEDRIDKKFLDNEVLEQIESFFNVRSCCEELENSMNMTESLIHILRQSILQEAIQGKLVPQELNDEPASVLLEKIKVEKEQLIKDKIIKKEKPLPPILEDEIPYELPQGWEWVRLGEVIELISGQHVLPDCYNADGVGIPYLTGPSDFSDKIVNVSRWTPIPKVVSIKNDILITVKGSGVGKLMVLNLDEAAISRQLMAIRNKFINNEFVNIVLKTSTSIFLDSAKGIAIPGIGREDVMNLLVALPPLIEQKRIVEKVDQLMALCDELEKTVEQSKQESEMLMKSVLQEAFNSTDTNDNVIEFPSVISNDIEDWEIAARSDGEIDSETKAKIKNRVTELLGKSRQ